jgi:hypothetical protein
MAEGRGRVYYARSKHGRVVVMDYSRIGKRPKGSTAIARIKRFYRELFEVDREKFLAWLG